MKQVFIAAIALLSLCSCNGVGGWFGTNDSTATTTNNTTTIVRDESITAENAYSDLFLDSNAVNNYISREKIDASMAEMMRNFYLLRNNQYAWFNSTGLTEEGRGFWSMYRAEEKTNDKEDSLENRMDSLVQKDSITINTSDSSYAMAELAITAKLVQQAFTDNGTITVDNIYTLVPRKKMSTFELADSILNKQKDSSFFARNTSYNNLKQQLSLYYNAAKNGGWPTVSASGLKKGSSSPAVTALKKRLSATGDYDAADTTAIFNDSLFAAIKDVQYRFGLAPTGKVNDSLINELNVPAEQRLQQIILNVNRSKWLTPTNDSTRIEVNIPAQMLYAYKGNNPVLEMPVIVGEEGTSTTMFSGKISEVVFNPAWKIPESIVRNEIVPAMKKDPNYLKKKNMERTGGTDSLPEIKQLPGKENALGRVKFLFPNSFDIYLHDTPDKSLFAKKDRRLSHGCIRVAKADQLAEFILGDWSREKVNSAMKADKEQSVKVKDPVAVNISYLTAWVDEKGKMSFRPDNYGHDKNTLARLFTASPASNVAGNPGSDTLNKQAKP
jgi:murein L,D-transpeptidase YcbB/YkuD